MGQQLNWTSGREDGSQDKKDPGTQAHTCPTRCGQIDIGTQWRGGIASERGLATGNKMSSMGIPQMTTTTTNQPILSSYLYHLFLPQCTHPSPLYPLPIYFFSPPRGFHIITSAQQPTPRHPKKNLPANKQAKTKNKLPQSTHAPVKKNEMARAPE